MRGKASISEHTEGFPMLDIEVDGFIYQFTVKDFPEAHREWLGNTVLCQMQQVHDRALNKARREIRDGLRELLDL